MLASAPIITVDTFADIDDPNDGLTSLREALVLAAANPGDDIVQLPFGTYNMDYNLGAFAIDDSSGAW